MKIGIVGLPNVGKSTLFNAITRAGAAAANYPFCTIEPNVGVVAVPDRRLDVLSEMYHPQKYTPATVEFVDIAGLVRGASRGEGLGNQFLGHIRECEAIVQVVRCFQNDDIVHVDGSIDPVRDMETIGVELLLADMQTVERRLERGSKAAKSGDKRVKEEVEALKGILSGLDGGTPARAQPLSDVGAALAEEMCLLTAKPTIYAANVSEDDLAADPADLPMVRKVLERAEREGAEVLVVSAAIEEEISTMDPEEGAAFLAELGVEESGLNRMIRRCYKLLGQISYLTAGEKEVRAWTITRGTKAPQAAGKIHSDFEKGFIRAEIVSFDDLMACGSMAAAKEKGLVRLEGKEYVVQDGDIILFRFNV